MLSATYAPIRRVEAETIGYAFYLLNGTKRAALSLTTVQAWLRLPTRLDQILVVFDKQGLPIGYATWAWVTAGTASNLRQGGGRAPYPEEWNDGIHLMIIDIVAPFGAVQRLVNELRQQLSTETRYVHYISRHKNSIKRRLITDRLPGDSTVA